MNAPTQEIAALENIDLMQNEIESKPFPVKGVVFDMDGLLMDSETLAMDALVESGVSLGYEMPLSFCQQMIGVPADVCRQMVIDTYGPEFPLEAFFSGQEVHLRNFVQSGRLALKMGVEPLLDYLDAHSIPRAIATSSSRYRTDHHLELVGLTERFDAIVTRDDVSRGKPHPEPYLLAAEKIGVSPDYCLALEDSPNGARAAIAAGIRVIVVPDLVEPTGDVRDNALFVMKDLHAVMEYLQQHHG